MLLALAIVTTVTVIALGSVMVWNLYESTYAGPSVPAPTAITPAGEPLRVGLARSPGGPSEWITLAKVLAQLQRDLDRPVVVRYAMSSEDQMRLFERGEIDVALMSTLAYLDVQAEGLVTMIATPVVLDEPMDAAVIVVRATAMRADRGSSRKRFAVSPDLAGASFAYRLLKERGEIPEDSSQTTTAGAQDANLRSGREWRRGRYRGAPLRACSLARGDVPDHRAISRSGHASDRRTRDTGRHDRRSRFDGAFSARSRAASYRKGARSRDSGWPPTPTTTIARVLDAVDRVSERAAFGSAHQ